jgi:hypothetical protein
MIYIDLISLFLNTSDVNLHTIDYAISNNGLSFLRIKLYSLQTAYVHIMFTQIISLIRKNRKV